MQVTRHIQKWGNGTGVRLPKKVVEAAHLELGQPVAVELRDSAIVLTPIPPAADRFPTLAQLLAGVTPPQIGGELNWGTDRGAEVADG